MFSRNRWTGPTPARVLIVALSSTLFAACSCGEPPSVATALAFTTQPSPAIAGEALAPAVQVTVRDADGVTVTTGSPVVTLALSANPGNAVLSGTVTAVAVDGVATFSGLSIDKAAAGYQLTASAVGLSPAQSTGFEVTAAAAGRLSFAVQPSNAASGALLSPAIRVSVLDAFGNQTASTAPVTVTIATGPTGATLGGTTTRAAVAGIATFEDLSLDLVGAYVLQAASGALPAVNSDSFELSPGAPTTLAFAQQPSDVESGVAISPAVTVRVLDAASNLVSTFAGPVSLALDANAAAGALNGTLTVNAVGGVASFGDLWVDRAGGGYTLRATSGALGDATSAAFNVRAGAPAALAFLQPPADAVAGSALSPAVRVGILDGFGNLTSSSGTVVLSKASGPGTLAGTVSRAAVAGVATFADLSLNLAGTYALTATAGALPAETSPTFTISAGAPARLELVTQPTDVLAGQAITPAVRARIVDAQGNTVTTAVDPVTIALGNNPGAGVLGGTLSVAAVAGVATFADLSLARAGAGYTLVVGSGAFATATSNAFNVTAGTPSRLVFVQQPTVTGAGAVISPAVTVALQDAYGNLTASTGSVALALGTNPAGGLLGGTLVRAAVGGVATFGDLSIDRAGAGYTLTATSGSLAAAASAPFDVTAGAPGRLVFGQQPTSATAGVAIAPAVTVLVQDSAGNTVTGSTLSITLALASGPAATLDGTTTVAAVSGVATFSGLSITTAGSGFSLRATASAVTAATSGLFDVAAAAPSRLAFVAQPSNTVAGVSIAPAVTVAIQDSFGNRTASTASVTVALGTNPGGSTLSGTVTLAAVAGLATFPNLSLNRAATGYRLAATSGTLTGATSALFDVSAAAPSRLVFVQQPSNVPAGSSISPAVTVAIQDAYGNRTAASDNVTVSLGTNPAGGVLSGTATRAASAGLVTFSDLRVDKAGTGYTLAATSSPLTGATSTAFNVLPAGGAFRMAFIDVGQGDGAVVISPSGCAAVLDGGPTGSGVDIKAYLKSQGITAVNFVIISHYHADHMGGIDEIDVGTDAVTVGAVYDRGGSYSSQTYTDYANHFAGKRSTVTRGQVISLCNEVTFQVVSVNGNGVSGASSNENSLSVGVKISYGAFDALVAGDLTGQSADVESTLIGNLGEVEGYKVHHHGSATSSNDTFLDEIRPTFGVISVGLNNTYGHPTAEALGRLSSHGVVVYQTEDPATNTLRGNVLLSSTDGTGYVITQGGTSTTFASKPLRPPPAPTGLVVTPAGANAIDLSWNASAEPARVIGYEVLRSTDGTLFTPAGMVRGTDFADLGLDPTTTYWYRVDAQAAEHQRSEPTRVMLAPR